MSNNNWLSTEDQEHFRLFAGRVKAKIAKYGKMDNDEEVLAQQRSQVEELQSLEKEWKTSVINSGKVEEAYGIFLDFILNEKKNRLAARPYFRERQSVFTASISPGIKARDVDKIQKYDINFLFIKLVAKTFQQPKDLLAIYNKVIKARNALIEINAPLAISKATSFGRNTPQSHLTFMDLVEITLEGLTNGVDKFCGEYSDTWRAVCIGRMTGNLIEDYNQTLIHFYPADKRKLYRAHKFISRKVPGSFDIKDVVVAVNTSPKEKNGKKIKVLPKVTEEEMSDLLAAASTVSSDSIMPEDDDNEGDTAITEYPDPVETRPDIMVEEHETVMKVRKALEFLTPYEHKVLRLKGVDFGG